MARKFILDFAGEEAEEDFPLLPRYLINWNTLDGATKMARNLPGYYSDMWLVKFKVTEIFRDPNPKALNVVQWAIGTNTKFLTEAHYWLDTGSDFPATPGATGQIEDKNGIGAIIVVLAEPQPAPWW